MATNDLTLTVMPEQQRNYFLPQCQ